ncbi:MAG: hypothetical protein Q7S02_03895 [bacterium]|nr:hypothetical protein [bacterium]
MTLVTWHLLVPFGLFVALFIVFAAIDIMHMVKFGTYTFANYLALVVFLGGTAVILWATAQLLAPVEWSTVVGNVGAEVFSGSGSFSL